MSKGRTYEARVEELLAPIVMEFDVEIYDIEYVKEGAEWYLRVYIDKSDGINIQDCEKVSRALSEKMDEEDFILESYILEVSSPGLGRTLKKDKHLQKSIGEKIDLKLFQAIDKCKEFTGFLKSFDKEYIIVEIEEEEVRFERAKIALIRLTIEF